MHSLRARRLSWLAAMVVMLIACLPSGALSQAAFALRDIGRATVPLDSGWKFHTGDDQGWAAPGFDDSAWQSIEVSRPWEGQGHPGYTGFGWYRLHLTLPANAQADWTLALLLPYVEDACEVYWNGELVGSVGKVPPHPKWFMGEAPARIDLGAPRSGVLTRAAWSACLRPAAMKPSTPSSRAPLTTICKAICLNSQSN
jgi:hypothetical protein